MGTKYTKPYFIRKFTETKEKDFPATPYSFVEFISPRAGIASSAFSYLAEYLKADSLAKYYSKRKKDGLTPKQRFLKDLKD